MDKNEKLMKGPWLTEGEIEAILATDSDAEFDRLFGRRDTMRRRRRMLWPLGIAAAVAGLVFAVWPDGATDADVAVTTAQTDMAVVQPPATDVGGKAAEGREAAATATIPQQNTATMPQQEAVNRRRQQLAVAQRHEPPGEEAVMMPDPVADDLIAAADITFAHAGMACEGMMTAAESELATDETFETPIHIDL